MPNFCKEKTIKEVLEFLDSFFIYNKIVIVMMDDDGNDHIVLEPTKYEDIKYSDIKHILDEKVYSLTIINTIEELNYYNENEDEDENTVYVWNDEPYFEITYCDPEGEWK